jgi:hypothetical protein
MAYAQKHRIEKIAAEHICIEKLINKNSRELENVRSIYVERKKYKI